eukprot:2229998-Amphidinium_carterae.1
MSLSCMGPQDAETPIFAASCGTVQTLAPACSIQLCEFPFKGYCMDERGWMFPNALVRVEPCDCCVSPC